MIATFTMSDTDFPTYNFEWDGKSTELWAWTSGDDPIPDGQREVVGRVDAAVFEANGPPTDLDMGLALMLAASGELKKIVKQLLTVTDVLSETEATP